MTIPTPSSGPGATAPGGEAVREWSVTVDAGLVAAALDLLVVFNDLVDQRHHGCVDYQLRSVIRADETEPSSFRLHQMRATLRATGRQLTETLQAGGFFADPAHARREWRTPR